MHTSKTNEISDMVPHHCDCLKIKNSAKSNGRKMPSILNSVSRHQKINSRGKSRLAVAEL